MADQNTSQPKPAMPNVTAPSGVQDKAKRYERSIELYVQTQDKLKKTVKLVSVLVPADYSLVLDGHVRVDIPKGYQDMPEEWAANWFSQANGVTLQKADKQEPAKAPEPPKPVPPTKK